MLLLTALPAEIIDHILGYVDPIDLARLPRTCKALYHAINDNNPLFKEVYLNTLDRPPQQNQVNWAQSLKDIVRLQAICQPDNIDSKNGELDFVHRTVTELLKNTSTDGAWPPGFTGKPPQSRNAKLLSELFKYESNKSAFLCRSFIYERARAEFHSSDVRYWHGPPKPEHQKSAHLHCLYGVPLLLAYPSAQRQDQNQNTLMHPFASSKVYDLRQYMESNAWGPFMDDGSMCVDWEKVEAIMIVLGANMEDLGISCMHMCKTFCSVPFAGTWSNSWKSPHSPSPPRELDALEHLDPYGVTGVWLRVVCFLDYSDFFAFNFAAQDLPPHVPRRTINMGQATRLILMRVFVTSIQDPGPNDGQDLPVVHFKGVSRSLDQTFDEGADSDLRGTVLLRGTVRLTPKGDVRWTTFSIYGGVERWRSESIQVGGIKSAKGVLGHWFDKDFDPHGPAGPTAFWKIMDERRSSQNAGGHDEGPFPDVVGITADNEANLNEEEEQDDDDEESDNE